MKPIIGAELTIDQQYHVTLLARNNHGYSNLCHLISKAQLGHSKGKPTIDEATLANYSSDIICLSGCRRGKIPSLLLAGEKELARATARTYLDIFGRDNFFIELQNNLRHGDRRLCIGLVELADSLGVRYVATNNVHYATQDKHRLHDVLVCIRNRTSLEKAGQLRRPNSEFRLKPGTEMCSLFSEYPQALENSLYIADQCNVDLDFSSYRFPEFPLPDGETANSFLGKLCWSKARKRYGELSDRPYR